MKKAQNESGFTLIEMLFVLAIFGIITSVAIFSFKPLSAALVQQEFFRIFQSDMLYAQQYAISRQMEVKVYIFPTENRYIVRQAEGKVIMERKYDNRVKVVVGTIIVPFSFKPSGNISNFGQIFVHIGKDSYRLTFLIGRGRMYVAKM